MIYTLMRFPRAASCMFISVKHDIGLDMRPSYRLDSATGFYLVDVDLMVRLVTLLFSLFRALVLGFHVFLFPCYNFRS